MKRWGWLAIMCLALREPAGAQWGVPHIGYAYPAGGQQGTTVAVLVGGQFLSQPRAAHVSGEGVQAQVVDYLRPLNDNDLRDVRWFLDNLVRRRWDVRVMEATRRRDDPPELPDHPWLRDLDEKSPTELAALRGWLFNPRRQLNPQLAEQVLLSVTIAPGAPPGDRELRLQTPSGLSNPVCFQVGTLSEVLEPEGMVPPADDRGTPTAPVVLNGQIMPGDSDRFAVRLQRGSRIVVRVQARHLVPYLADAVPGWFQATAALLDPSGREVAFADDFRFDPDPVLLYQVPADGEYTLEVKDALYRGREDFVYRVVVGELPFITGMFPPAGEVGKPLSVALMGWNLPLNTSELATGPGAKWRWAEPLAGRAISGALPYLVEELPTCVDAEPNNAGNSAQTLTLPMMVVGRIDQPGDVDVFRFSGRAGMEIVAQVYARRLYSPLDARLALVEATGQEVAANDDTADPEFGLLTHQADPFLQVKLPRDGEYYLRLTDAQGQGGPGCFYCLQVAPPRPDFAVRLTPAGAGLRVGRPATLTAHVVRREGFAGEISVALAGGPEGLNLSGGKIPPDKTTANLTLSLARPVNPTVFALRFEASAPIGGRVVTHPVAPAEDMMQAFAYRHLVPQQEFVVAQLGAKPVPAVWRPLARGLQVSGETPVAVPLGGTALVALRGPVAGRRFELAAAPRGVRFKGTVPVEGGVGLLIKADGNMATVGSSGHLLIGVSGPDGDEGVLPPVPVQVVYP